MSTPSDVAVSPTLAPWEFAGLLLTYWCSARCAFCYECAGPEHNVWMRPPHALALWRGLDALAAEHGVHMRVHLAGGEPFGDWALLASVLRAARDAGLSPPDKVETNAYWATDDGLTRSRLELLAALGVQRLTVSTDVYHQEFVPFERVARCVRIAREVLGHGRVIARWWSFFQHPQELGSASDEERTTAYRAALARHPDRLAGRAAHALAPLLPQKPATAYADQHCAAELLDSRHVHVDPYGNIFPGTCGGIILGRATAGMPAAAANRANAGGATADNAATAAGATANGATVEGATVADVWHTLVRNWRVHPIVGPLAQGGPVALLAAVRPWGYVERAAGYASKCHLCAHVRTFLVQRGLWSECVGPAECYPAAPPAGDA